VGGSTANSDKKKIWKIENRVHCAPLMMSRSFRYFSFEHDLFV